MRIMGELKAVCSKEGKPYYKGHIGKVIPITAFNGKGNHADKIFLCLDHQRAGYFDKKAQEARAQAKV